MVKRKTRLAAEEFNHIHYTETFKETQYTLKSNETKCCPKKSQKMSSHVDGDGYECMEMNKTIKQ